MAIILLLTLLLLLIYQLGWTRLYAITNNTKQAQIHLMNSPRTHCRLAVAFVPTHLCSGTQAETLLAIAAEGEKRKKILLALKAFAQELYITLARISLTKANHIATSKLNKVEMYDFPAKKVPPENGKLGEQYHQLHYY